MDFDTVADELYRLDPEEFVPARAAAVSEARASGDRLLATRIGALKKPTRSAWLVNLLARQETDELGGLKAVAERVARAHAGADLAALREVGAERQKLVDALTRQAVAAANGRGYRATEGVRLEVHGTLSSAVADPEVLRQVLAGRVVKSQLYSGFGLPLGAAAPAAVTTPQSPTGPVDAGQSEAADQRERQRREAERAIVAATDRLVEARGALKASEATEQQASQVLDRASQEVADLRTELRAAEQAEEQARRSAGRASDELHDARTVVQQAERTLAEATRALGDRGGAGAQSSAGS